MIKIFLKTLWGIMLLHRLLLRILYLHVWVGVTQPKGPEKPH